MKKYVVFLSIMVAIVATGVTNVAVRIQPIKDWRLKNERIYFFLIADNLGDTSLLVATNEVDVFHCQLYGGAGIPKHSLQMMLDELIADSSDCLMRLEPSKRAVTDVIGEYYRALYLTNELHRLEFNLGNGNWIWTETLTNHIEVINPISVNQLGQVQLMKTTYLNEPFTVSFFEVTIPNGERWVYHSRNIPICRMRPGNTITIAQTTPSDWVRITDGVSVVLFNCRMRTVERGDAYATPHWQWIQDERRRNR